ncbi:salicylate hydroxylase [Neofusicoccum parvum]|uniref:Salicylate hydroxylase n=1 Tax=Neofusicoccum parvum TaxID=310453 RepID=A0ACB5RTA7_9PEZI|nr:salicylate hydroxylase [Neofusicoccum parvum]
MSSEGLRVVIVGAGFCGLTAAIETKLRGMNPILVETYPSSKNYGDVIDFFNNGGMIINRWADGRIGRKMLKICINQGDKFQFFAHDGTFLCEEPWNSKPHHYYQQFAGHRGEMHQLVVDYAEEIGVDMRFGEKVVQYLDTESEIGVITEKGEKILGDVVLAADGPRSLARQLVLGLPDNKVNSGYAIYRAFFTLTEEHRKNPLLTEFCDPNKDMTRMWVGTDLHGIIYTWNRGKDIGWVLTHKDDHDIGESWSFPGRKEDVLGYLDNGWNERFKEAVRQTPEKQLVDYKLVWREPLTTWLSNSARIAVIGDAAHCHLPSSGQGGAQALEDGVAVAVALKRANGDVPLALRVFERIRFNRSHVIHMSSVTNRDDYHQVVWTPEFVRDHPGALSIPRMDWIMEHDAKANAEEHFDHLAADVRNGRLGTLGDLSLPAGGSYSSVRNGKMEASNDEFTEKTMKQIPVLDTPVVK